MLFKGSFQIVYSKNMMQLEARWNILSYYSAEDVYPVGCSRGRGNSLKHVGLEFLLCAKTNARLDFYIRRSCQMR